MRQKWSRPSIIARVMNGAHRLDDRAGGLEGARRGLDGCRGLGSTGRPAAGVEQQADAQALQRRAAASVQSMPAGGRLIVSRASGCDSTLIISAASATLRVIGPATRP